MGTFSKHVSIDPARNQLNQNLLWYEVPPMWFGESFPSDNNTPLVRATELGNWGGERDFLPWICD